MTSSHHHDSNDNRNLMILSTAATSLAKMDSDEDNSGGSSSVIAENELQEAPADEKEEPLADPTTTSSPRKRNKLDMKWEAHLEELRQYKALIGSTSVPVKSQTYGTLGKWCENQRGRYHAGKLSEERIHKLREVGFIFEANAARSPNRLFPSYEKLWRTNVENLKEFMLEFGHAHVPPAYGANPTLGKWVENTRCKYNRGELSEERVDELKEVGFAFQVESSAEKLPYKSYAYEQKWEQHLQQLIDYRDEHGDCNVPTKYDVNPKLAKWCENQKGAYLKNNLKQERIDRLKAVGFSFEKRKRGGARADRV